MKNLFLKLSVLLCIIECQKESTQQNKPQEDNPTYSILVDSVFVVDLNTKALDILKINNNSYYLEAHLWRNFMPGMDESNDKGLLALNTLVEANSKAIPDNIDMIKQYIIQQDSVCVIDYTNQAYKTPLHKKQKISRRGPFWGPKSYVDVVSEIYDTNTSTNYFVKAENVFIEKAE